MGQRLRTKKAAEQALAKTVVDIDGGLYVEPIALTVERFLEKWLQDYVEPNLRPKTAHDYRQLIRLYLTPTLGDIPVAGLRPTHIQDTYTAMREKGLSARTIRYTHSVLRGALQHAYKRQEIPRNPADAVVLPKHQRPKTEILEPDEFMKLLSALEPAYELPVRFSLWTGLRRGEVFGLRWSDLGLSQGTITVRQAVQRLPGRGLVMVIPKSDASRRTIAMSEGLATELTRHRADQAERQLALGELYQDNDLVFAANIGKPLDPDLITKAFKRATRAIGRPNLRLHDARHSHASMLLRNGSTIRLVADRLGHSSASFTLSTYVQSGTAEDREAADKFDDLITGTVS